MALGLAYVVLAVLQRRLCWLAGGTSAALFLWIFWYAQLPTQALLQLYYVAVAVHGWWHWGHADGQRRPLPVQRWRGSAHLAALAAIVLLTVATLLLRGAPAGLTPVLDAGTAWGSAVATWMVARKVLENWLYWIAIDSAAVVMYLYSGLLATAGLYALYTLIAIAGWIQWRRSLPPASAP